MKWLSRLAVLALWGGLLLSPAVAQDAEKQAPAADAAAERAVEVVFVLDTTGSMGGLIQAAKEKVWAIANTLATAKPAPTVKMGLVGYRDRGDAYVTRVTQLTDDLDAVYKELMEFQAAGGGDGPESVNQALHEALSKIDWSTDDTTYRVIFLVGDAPPHMDYADDVKFPESCEKAAKASIVINTIQCGSQPDTTPVWIRIAQLAEGKYFKVEQAGGAIVASTPFDAELAKLAGELDGTKAYYGDKAERMAARRKLAVAREVAASAPAGAAASRAEFRASDAAKKADADEADLITGIANGKVKLDEIADKDLPEELQELNAEERKVYVSKQVEKRAEIEKQIEELSQKRQAYIKEQIAKQVKESGKQSLDGAIYESIQQQAAKVGLVYKGGPSF